MASVKHRAKRATQGDGHAIPGPVPIRQRIVELTRGKRKVAAYLMDHREQAVFMTANQVSERTGVDTATVVRTAQALGYSGYPEMQEALREEFLNDLTPLEVMRSTVEEGADFAAMTRRLVMKDIANLDTLHKNLDESQLTRVVEKIYSASRIVIVGLDLASVLTTYLEYLLQTLEFPAVAATAGGGRLRNHLNSLRKDGLLIGISFRRCLRETVNAVNVARKRGVYTVAITDSFASPLTRFSDMFFLTPIQSNSFADSYVAPLSLIGAIVLACAEYDQKRSLAILEVLEKEYRNGNRWY